MARLPFALPIYGGLIALGIASIGTAIAIGLR
jgi:hypothetical protein